MARRVACDRRGRRYARAEAGQLFRDALAAQAPDRRRDGGAAARSRTRRRRHECAARAPGGGSATSSMRSPTGTAGRTPLPGDPLFADQWYFQSTQPAATHAEQAWDVTVGSNTTVVAVLDTGVRFEHPDLLRRRHRPASSWTASISFPTRRSRTTATAATPTPAIPATG